MVTPGLPANFNAVGAVVAAPVVWAAMVAVSMVTGVVDPVLERRMRVLGPVMLGWAMTRRVLSVNPGAGGGRAVSAGAAQAPVQVPSVVVRGRGATARMWRVGSAQARSASRKAVPMLGRVSFWRVLSGLVGMKTA